LENVGRGGKNIVEARTKSGKKNMGVTKATAKGRKGGNTRGGSMIR